MNASAPPELRRAVRALWRIVEPTPSHLYTAPAFNGLIQVCQAHYPDVGSDQSLKVALWDALNRLGFRWTVDCPSQRAVPADIAADKIDAAFRQTRSRRIHLCPLDLADEISVRHFGPNQIRTFAPAELDSLVDPHGVMRRWPDIQFDSERFAQFAWLVVEEHFALPGSPARRALPGLFKNLTKDFGCIKPHETRFPPKVEAALFALLTAPWEDVTRYNDFEWRPFRIPWVYTIDDDLFARAAVPPDAHSLTWVSDFHRERDGEEVEFERPLQLPLNDDAEEKTNYLNDETWSDVALALASPLFAGPVSHFLVRAFATDGIDEFLAHITVIEAALGASADRNSIKPGPTALVAARLSALLDDPLAAARYKRLFGKRSDFLHGRKMPDIQGDLRLEARRLARRCVCALIDAAISDAAPSCRNEFLGGLIIQS